MLRRKRIIRFLLVLVMALLTTGALVAQDDSGDGLSDDPFGSLDGGRAQQEEITIGDLVFNLFDEVSFGSEIGDAVQDAVTFLNNSFSWLFRDLLRWPIDQLITFFEDVLIAVPWFVVIGVVAAIAWITVRRATAIMSAVSLMIIGFLGLWELTMTTFAMLITAMLICLVIGIPLGIWAARSDRVNNVMRPVLDAMQTIHPFVYLVPIVVLIGVGTVPGTIATIIFALPPMVRLTTLGIRQVREDVVEAARSFGANDRQLLFDVQLPLALPSIMAGVNQTLMLALSMVVIVALIGGGGVGEEIYNAIGSGKPGRAVVAGVCVLLLAVVLDRISQGWTNVGSKTATE